MRIITKTNYLDTYFQEDQELRQSNNWVQTGFSGIDDYISIRSGVYLIGGLPSVGKTTFVLQLADHFAELGKNVLFFSLEQEEYDLTIKSINRIQKQNHLNREEAIAKYRTVAKHIVTATTKSSIVIESIEETINDYMTHSDEPPIVFVDYLQKIQTEKISAKKDSISFVSDKLVELSKKHNLTMFVLSSLNRMNYMSQIDFESFKESGSLEYDADVVLGLQYQIISSDKFINCSSVDQKRIMLNEAKTDAVRKVELVCLKNRFGEIAPKCKLDYFPDKDFFVDSQSSVGGIRVAKKQVRSF